MHTLKNENTENIQGTPKPSRRIIGDSEPMQAVLRQVAQVAPMNATVLITGETGVGKDVIAQAIHDRSPRNARPFKPVNSGELEDLLQSELFGHEKGAFTGAASLRRGVFEQANGGTLFLDEVGEMSREVQVKFLRVLENQEFTRLGGEKNINVDVRIIAATNVDLVASVDQGRFRQDLYYRLNLFRIQIPPLRERRADIPLFVEAFLSELSEKLGKPITGITAEALQFLQNHEWPGNVRELRNAVEYASIRAITAELQRNDFPEPEQVTSLPVQVEQARPVRTYGSDDPESGSILFDVLSELGLHEHLRRDPERLKRTLLALIKEKDVSLSTLNKNKADRRALGDLASKGAVYGFFKRSNEALKQEIPTSEWIAILKTAYENSLEEQVSTATALADADGIP